MVCCVCKEAKLFGKVIHPEMEEWRRTNGPQRQVNATVAACLANRNASNVSSFLIVRAYIHIPTKHTQSHLHKHS